MYRETMVHSQENLHILSPPHLYQSTGFDRRRPLHHIRQTQQQTKASASSYETVHSPVPRRLPSPPIVPNHNNTAQTKPIDHSPSLSANKARAMAHSTQQEGEKRELNTLNDRFGNYLEKIKHLASVNIHLRRQVDDAYRNYIGHVAKQEELGVHQATNYQHPSELQLNQLRQQINEQVRAQTLIQIRSQRADYDVKFYQKNLQLFNSHEQKQTDQVRTMRQQLDANLHEFEQLKQQYSRREHDLQLCRGQYNEYIDQLVGYSNEHDRVTYERMENENLLYTLKEQLAFEKEYGQRRQQEFEYLEKVHNDCEKNFTQKEFQTIVQRIREDYQEFNAIRLEELNTFYKTKLESVRTELTKREEQQHEVTKPRDIMLAVDTTKKEYRTLIEQNQFLQTKLEQSERDLHHVIEQNRQRYELADRDYRQLQNDVPELDCILVQLRETTVHLWSEINTYRYLLVNLLSTNPIQSQQATPKVHPPAPLPKPKTIVENTKVKSYPQQYRDETTGFVVHIEDGIIWVRI